MSIRYVHPVNGYDFTGRTAYSSSTTYTSGTTGAIVHNNVAAPNRWVYEFINATPASGQPLSATEYWTLRADGTSGYPYLSITDAHNSLTGGDEVRVAESSGHALLAGLYNFTNDSGTVTVTSGSTGEYAAYDLIGNDTIGWWEVSSTAGTPVSSVSLASRFYGTGGTSATGQTCYRLGAYPSNNSGYTITYGGNTTTGAFLTFSGGWNLTTNTQTGMTYFRNTSATKTNPFFYASNSRNYIKIQKLGAARFNQFNSSVFYYGEIDQCESYWTDDRNINMINGKISNCKIFGGKGTASINTIIVSSTYCGRYSDGYLAYYGGYTIWIDCNIIKLQSGWYSYTYAQNKFINCLFGSVPAITTHTLFRSEYLRVNSLPGTVIHNYNRVENDHRIYASAIAILSDSTTRHTSSGVSWQLTATALANSTIPGSFRVGSIVCSGGKQITFSVWVKKSNASSDYEAQLVCPANQLGLTTDYTSAATDTTDWQQLTVNVTPSIQGVLDFYVDVWGSSSYTTHVDDISVTEAT